MCAPDELAGFAMFAGLNLAQLEAVAAIGRPVNFPTGRRIIEEGRAAERCWLIQSGHVALQTALPNGQASTVQTLGRGDLLGWSWLLPPHRWQFDGVSIADVAAIELDGVRLRELAAEDTSLGYVLALRLAEALANRLHGTRARLMDMYGSPRAD